ncbi:hypothetical protein RI367_005028 [Sorochytrium milnesiophthora]
MSMARDKNSSSSIDLPEVVTSQEDITFEASTDDSEQRFDTIIGTLEDLLLDPQFLKAQHDFFECVYHDFEDREENKLVYMDAFKQYVTLIEDMVEQFLRSRVPSFDMAQFLEMIKSRPDQVDGDVFEVLSSLGDFNLFKELVLSYKKEKEGAGFDLSGLIVCSSTTSRA